MRCIVFAILPLALTACTAGAPDAAKIVNDGQSAVAAAGGAITVAASAACLAQQVLAVGALAAADTHNARDATTLANAGTASGRLCVWQNPTPK